MIDYEELTLVSENTHQNNFKTIPSNIIQSLKEKSNNLTEIKKPNKTEFKKVWMGTVQIKKSDINGVDERVEET